MDRRYNVGYMWLREQSLCGVARDKMAGSRVSR